MRLYHKDRIVLLLVLDLAAMLCAFILALILGHNQPATAGLVWYYRWGIATLLVSTVIIFFILNLYSLHDIPNRFILQVLSIIIGLLLSAIIVTFIFFFFRNTVPRAVFLLFYAFSLVFITAFRGQINRLSLSVVFWRILIVGERDPLAKIIRLIQERKYLHSRIVGYLSLKKVNNEKSSAVPHLGCADQLLSIVEKAEIDHVILAVTEIDRKLTGALLDCMKRKIKVTDFNQFVEAVAGKVPIEYLSARWFFEELSAHDKRYYWYAKRTLDVLFSLIGLCLTLPFLPLIAFLIKLDSRGPVFYSQTRIGRDNLPFLLWKLRTMVLDADKNNVHWTTDNDSRITMVGRLLRKMRVDELPQLFNILKGDMTLIGPRPEAVSLVELYRREIPFYQERHMVTPGITGWAQINYSYGNSIEDALEKLKYDLYYIKNRGFILDAIIFLRTIRIVLTGKGAL